jgi:hypothetical protein
MQNDFIIMLPNTNGILPFLCQNVTHLPYSIIHLHLKEKITQNTNRRQTPDWARALKKEEADDCVTPLPPCAAGGKF